MERLPSVNLFWRKSCRALAFTLVELLVVIAIVGILVALILPAIQAARESSRRTRCANNLKQNATAIHLYQGANRVLPPGAKKHTSAGKVSISWRVLILPYLEEGATFARINPSAGGGATNWDPDGSLPAMFGCPSAEPDPDTWKRAAYWGINGAARNNERIDLEDIVCGDLFTNGVLYPFSVVYLKDITDGTSHTLAIGERTYTFFSWMTGADWKGSPYSRICGHCTNNIRYPINSSHDQVGYYIADGTAPAGSVRIPENDLYFGSKHLGGANFCYADGSVRMLPDTIDFKIYEDLATRAGGETNIVPP